MPLRRLPHLALLALGVAAGALAQTHPAPARPRPLHERITRADAAALISVEVVSEGRLRVRRIQGLLGELPEVFEVKRSPLQPPPLAASDRALLFLRGARAPYVLADEGSETIRIADAEMEERWVGAFSNVHASSGTPGKLASVYLDWIDAGPSTLRALAPDGLAPLLAADPALHERVSLARAPRAADASAPLEARALSAGLAAATPAGASDLAAALVASGDLGDGNIVELSLRAASLARARALAGLFGAACAHADPEIRTAAMRALPPVAVALGEPAIERARQLAENDPDQGVRRTAVRALRNTAPRAR